LCLHGKTHLKKSRESLAAGKNASKFKFVIFFTSKTVKPDSDRWRPPQMNAHRPEKNANGEKFIALSADYPPT